MARTDTLTNFLTDVADSIRSKTGKSDAIACEDFDTEIESISGGGTVEVQEKDVNFYDYDGTLVDSYSKADFLALNSLPENPTHSGLTAQGWNWSLADAKSYVTDNNELDIGQMYDTDDGTTRLYIHLEEGRLAPYLGFAIDGTATIDWGDNSTPEIITGTSPTIIISTQHIYEKSGDYVISIYSESTIQIKGESSYGSVLLWDNKTTNNSSNKIYQNSVTKIEFGNVKLSLYGCSGFACLEEVVISTKVANRINGYFFRNCYSIKAIIFPNTITRIDNYCMSYCISLRKMVLPNTLTVLDTQSCEECHVLHNIILPMSITGVYSSLFKYNYNLNKAIIPSNVTSIGSSAFQYCYGLKQIKIPSNVTSIGSSAFQYCYNLSVVKIPSNVTSIESNVFGYCCSIKVYDFSTHTSIPTLSNTNAFSYISSDCNIVVPDSLYDSWIAATNWSSLASKIIKESDFNA